MLGFHINENCSTMFAVLQNDGINGVKRVERGAQNPEVPQNGMTAVSVCVTFLDPNTAVSGLPGDQPRDERRPRRGAARPRRVVEPHSQEQDPAGAHGPGAERLQLHSALGDANQVLQTGSSSCRGLVDSV